MRVKRRVRSRWEVSEHRRFPPRGNALEIKRRKHAEEGKEGERRGSDFLFWEIGTYKRGREEAR